MAGEEESVNIGFGEKSEKDSVDQENSSISKQPENKEEHNENEINDAKLLDQEEQVLQNNVNDVAETQMSQGPSSPGTGTNERLIKLPLSRIKVIMKSDPDVTLASQEAVVALTKATELFICALSKDAVVSTLNSKRKTLQRKDLDTVLDTRDGYAFLEGTLD